MWTFDRYQRWIEQQKEWVRPATSPPAIGDGGIVRAATRLVTPPGRKAAASPQAAPGAAAPRPAPASAADIGEEINIDEPLDLEEIAALARKIEQSTPQR
jgi:hypothetical protein